VPVFSRLAHHVFFGRGSFPDVTPITSYDTATSHPSYSP
jgi:hypothetical protein